MSEQAKSITIGDATFHLVYADLLPPLSEAKYTSLRASIHAMGIRDDIHVRQRADGSYDVIDGQHRLTIAAELDLPRDAVPLKEHDVDDDTAETLAYSLNLARRHLSAEDRQQVVAALRQKGKSLRQIAELVGVSHVTVQRDIDALEATGVTNVTPATVTGTDGKQQPAQKPQTRTAALAEKIMAMYGDRETTLYVDDIRAQLGDTENAILHAAIGLLMAEYRIRQHSGERGRYDRIAPVNGEQVRKAILDVLYRRQEPIAPDKLERKAVQRVRAPITDIHAELDVLKAQDRVIDVDRAWTRVPPQPKLEQVLNTLAEHGPATVDDIHNHARMDATEVVPALAHLQHKGRVIRRGDAWELTPDAPVAQREGDDRPRADRTLAVIDGQPVTAADIPGYEQLAEDAQRRAELNARFNTDAVKINAEPWDQGAWHRAIEVARKLRAADLWDGQSLLSFNTNVYELHDRLFGVKREPVTSLVKGRDYTIVPTTSRDDGEADHPTIAQVRDAICAVLQERDHITSIILHRVRQRLGAHNIPFASAFAELRDEGIVVPTGRNNPAGEAFFTLAEGDDSAEALETKIVAMLHDKPLPYRAIKARLETDGMTVTDLGERLAALLDAGRIVEAGGLYGLPAHQHDQSPRPAAGEQTSAPPVDDDMTMEDAKAQIMEFLSNRAGAYWNTLNAMGIPTHLADMALRELVRERKVRKSHDRFYEVIQPHTELKIALGSLESSLEGVRREIKALPLADLEPGHVQEAREAILHARVEMSELYNRLEALLDKLPGASETEEQTEEPACV